MMRSAPVAAADGGLHDRDASSSSSPTFSQVHSLSGLGLSSSELEELDRLMTGAGDYGGDDGGASGGVLPETEDRPTDDPPGDDSASIAPSPEAIAEAGSRLAAATSSGSSSEVDELNRIMALHRILPRPPSSYVPYAPELDGYGGDERRRRRVPASTPGAVRVVFRSGNDEEEKEEVSMDGPRAGGRWKSGGGGNNFARVAPAATTASNDDDDEQQPRETVVASPESAPPRSAPPERSSGIIPAAAAPRSGGEEPASPPSDLEAGVVVDDNDSPRDDDDESPRDDDNVASGGDASDSDSTWDPSLPIAAAVVPRRSGDDPDDVFMDDDHSNVVRVVPAVKAERVRWRTHLKDRWVRFAIIVACVLVVGLALTLGLTLLFLRGSGEEGREEFKAAQEPKGRDDGVADAGGGNGACSRGYRPTCGECWCANDGFADSDPEAYSCPPYPDGWLNSCDDRTFRLGEVYKTFQMTSKPEYLSGLPRWETHDDGGEVSSQLVTNEGSPCDPFLYHSGDPQSSNPWEGLPKCYGSNVDPTFSVRTSVCAFKFPEGTVESSEGCVGRPYEVVTHRSFGTAGEVGATVTHFGACGVCSTAQDLSAILLHGDSFYERISLCDARHFSEDGSVLDYHRKVQSCYEETLGMTSDCALSYAIYSLGRQTFCNNECGAARSYSTNRTKFWLGGDPPRCEKTECYRCTEKHQAFGLSAIVGRVDVTTGVTTDGRYSCNAFAAFPRIDHDPCDGAL